MRAEVAKSIKIVVAEIEAEEGKLDFTGRTTEELTQ